MSDRSVSTHDIDLLREILDLSRIPPGLSPTEAMFAVLDRIEALIGCDGIAYHVMDGVHRQVRYGQESLDGQTVLLTPAARAAMADDPSAQELWQKWWVSRCSLPERSRRDMVATLRTWYTAREWAEHWIHKTCTPADDQFLLGYPTGHGTSMRIMAPREHGSPYGTREITLLELLLPHLRPLVETVYAPHEEARPALTSRQVAILELVQLGMSNQQIAHQLGLSVATVRKHLQNAYTRLEVLSRTEAVNAWFGPTRPTTAPPMTPQFTARAREG